MSYDPFVFSAPQETPDYVPRARLLDDPTQLASDGVSGVGGVGGVDEDVGDVVDNHYCVDIGGDVAYDVGEHPEFGVLQAVALQSKMWPQHAHVTVSFMGGTRAERELVRNVVMQTYAPLMNLKIEFVNEGGLVRVDFAPDQGSWSALGTDAKLVDASKPTMNFGWLDNPPAEGGCCYGVIKHEFGHCLGAFLHEHQNPNNNPIEWDKRNVIRALSRPPNSWDSETVHTNMFERYAHDEIRGTMYDPDSIMHYSFPPSWTTQRLVIPANQSLSLQDKYTLQLAYPRTETSIPKSLKLKSTNVNKTNKTNKTKVEKRHVSDGMLIGAVIGNILVLALIWHFVCSKRRTNLFS